MDVSTESAAAGDDLVVTSSGDAPEPTPDPPAASAQGDGDAGESSESGETHHADPEPDAAAVSAAASTLAKRKRTAQDRINDLARDKYRLEGELAALRSQTRPATAADPVATPPVASDGRTRPKEEDFDTYAAYVDAAADYRVQLALAADRQARAEQSQASQYQQVVSAADARIAAFAAAHPDYHDVIRSQTEVFPTPLLLDAVTHSDLTAEIAYHLNTHVDEYRALVSLAPGPMLKALGKLEARLEAAQPAALSSPKPGLPPPPAPITPVRTGGSAAAVAPDDLEFGPAYVSAMNAQDQARGRRR